MSPLSMFSADDLARGPRYGAMTTELALPPHTRALPIVARISSEVSRASPARMSPATGESARSSGGKIAAAAASCSPIAMRARSRVS